MKADTTDPAVLQRTRQGLYWRLVSALFDQGEAAQNLETLARSLAKTADVPAELLDPRVTIDVLLHKFPKLRPDFARPLPGFEPEDSERAEPPTDLQGTVQRALVVSKLLLNSFGPNTQGKVTAQQYGAWAKDVEWLEGALGLPPGSLRTSGAGQLAGRRSAERRRRRRHAPADRRRRAARRPVDARGRHDPPHGSARGIERSRAGRAPHAVDGAGRAAPVGQGQPDRPGADQRQEADRQVRRRARQST
jgi:hypothetical protein